MTMHKDICTEILIDFMLYKNLFSTYSTLIYNTDANKLKFWFVNIGLHDWKYNNFSDRSFYLKKPGYSTENVTFSIHGC